MLLWQVPSNTVVGRQARWHIYRNYSTHILDFLYWDVYLLVHNIKKGAASVV